MNEKDRSIAVVDAMNEALTVAVVTVDRQAFGELPMYPKEGSRRFLIEHERAEAFLLALRRLGYEVVPA